MKLQSEQEEKLKQCANLLDEVLESCPHFNRSLYWMCVETKDEIEEYIEGHQSDGEDDEPEEPRKPYVHDPNVLNWWAEGAVDESRHVIMGVIKSGDSAPSSPPAPGADPSPADASPQTELGC